MTPGILFCYALAVAGGVLAIGGASLFVLFAFLAVVAWSKRVPPAPAE